MMNLHPDLFVFDETHWIPKMYDYYGAAEAETDTLIDIVRRNIPEFRVAGPTATSE